MAVDEKAAEQIRADNTALETVVAELTARNAELTAKVEALTKQVELLTELLNRNSKNSHLPPSSDGPGASYWSCD